MRLTENFTLEELCKSSTAIRRGIKNVPDDQVVVEALRALCQNVLEPVRKQFGPFTTSSGYRSPELNRVIGGSRVSQHMLGEAADFEVPGVSNLQLAQWILRRVAFDQLILEFYQSGQPASGWVHCSYVAPPKVLRREVLTTPDGASYRRGLAA